MPLIIDGYNLLFSIQKNCETFHSITDFQLCQIISRYLNIINETGEIVFDGIGPPDKSPFFNINNPEVIFVGPSTDADSVIEIKIQASSTPRRLIVVSSDRRIRKAAKARKVIDIKSENFWKTVTFTKYV